MSDDIVDLEWILWGRQAPRSIGLPVGATKTTRTDKEVIGLARDRVSHTILVETARGTFEIVPEPGTVMCLKSAQPAKPKAKRKTG